MTFSLILDMDQDILENDYTQEFNDQYGIIDIIPTGYMMGGYKEMEIFFKTQDLKDQYIKEFDIE